MPKLEDEKEATEVMEELKQIVNETYENKNHIKPTYTSSPYHGLRYLKTASRDKL